MIYYIQLQNIPVIPSVKQYVLTGCEVALNNRWAIVDDLDLEFDLVDYAKGNFEK